MMASPKEDPWRWDGKPWDARFPPPRKAFEPTRFENRDHGYTLMPYAHALARATGASSDTPLTNGFEEDLYWLKMPSLKRAFTDDVDRRIPEAGDEFPLTDGKWATVQSVQSFPKKSRVVFLAQLIID